MQVRDVMTAKPEFLNFDATLEEAARKMKETDSGCIPIGRDNKLIGMLTDRDIAIRAVAEGRDYKEQVGNLTDGKVLYCFEDDDVKDVLWNMREQHVQRLVVLKDKEHRDFVGMVTVSDIADKCSDSELAPSIAACCKHYH